MDGHRREYGPATPIGPAQLKARVALDADQTASDADQTASDADQTASDADHAAAEQDRLYAATDQFLSDRDQASADRDHAYEPAAASKADYERSRAERAQVSLERRVTHGDRQRTAEERDATARVRDANAARRDERAAERDAFAASLEGSIAAFDGSIAQRFGELREEAAADRAEAARDRDRAASDRAEEARERARLEAELLTAHLDDLTGAYRREMGRLAISHEIARARRAGGRFVVAFLDVDDLKGINDRDGHAAGDQALRSVVGTMRHALRSYDPIVRYGGDEFVAGMGGIELAEAERRFESVRSMLARGAGVSISVGLATLADEETADELIARADQALSSRKQFRHRRNAQPESLAG